MIRFIYSSCVSPGRRNGVGFGWPVLLIGGSSPKFISIRSFLSGASLPGGKVRRSKSAGRLWEGATGGRRPRPAVCLIFRYLRANPPRALRGGGGRCLGARLSSGWSAPAGCRLFSAVRCWAARGPSRAAGAPLRRGGARNCCARPCRPAACPLKPPAARGLCARGGAFSGKRVPLLPRRCVKTRRSRCVGAFGQLVAEGRAAACLPPFSALREPLRVVCASARKPARGKLAAARRGDRLR